ncbi:MAG: class I SAM-dependent methyltransferase [Gaiellaceae bacterium]
MRRPALWRLFRGPIRAQFDHLAPGWDGMRRGDPVAVIDAALPALDPPPRRILDLGTGTGLAAFILAERFPQAHVVGVDLSSRMVEEAKRKSPPELRARIRFEQGDASALPYEDAAFDLVSLANMIPFFDELARLVAPGGAALFSFSIGSSTPIYVAPERIRAELGRRGFTEFADFSAGPGTAVLARRG